MKKLIIGITLLVSVASFANNIVTCEDPKDPRGEQNIVMIKETGSGAFKVIALVLDHRDYLTEGFVYCAIGGGPIGGMKNGKQISCELSSGEIAYIQYVDKGKGSASLFDQTGDLSVSFNDFNCY